MANFLEQLVISRQRRDSIEACFGPGGARSFSCDVFCIVIPFYVEGAKSGRTLGVDSVLIVLKRPSKVNKAASLSPPPPQYILLCDLAVFVENSVSHLMLGNT